MRFFVKGLKPNPIDIKILKCYSLSINDIYDDSRGKAIHFN